MNKTTLAALTLMGLMGASATLMLGSHSAQAALIYDNRDPLCGAQNIKQVKHKNII